MERELRQGESRVGEKEKHWTCKKCNLSNRISPVADICSNCHSSRTEQNKGEENE